MNGATPKNSSSNRLINIGECHANHNEFKLIRVPSTRQYYFHFPSAFPTSSFSLSYCEHQQTTYYSSTGFTILRSSPHFLFIRIVDSKETSSFQHHNAVLSVIDQSLSTSIVTLMPLNTNNSSIDSDQVNSTKTTPITTIISNTTLIHTSLSTTQPGIKRIFNLAVIVGLISASLLLIIVVIYALLKCRNRRDEGSYKIDESKNFVVTSQLDQHGTSGCGNILSSSNNHRQKLITLHEQNGVDSREWYV